MSRDPAPKIGRVVDMLGNVLPDGPEKKRNTGHVLHAGDHVQLRVLAAVALGPGVEYGLGCVADTLQLAEWNSTGEFEVRVAGNLAGRQLWLHVAIKGKGRAGVIDCEGLGRVDDCVSFGYDVAPAQQAEQ